MFVFGLAAVALAVYGMATLNPSLSNDAWAAIGSVSTFLRSVVARIGGVKTSVQDVQATTRGSGGEIREETDGVVPAPTMQTG
jgi:hypothetical protein